MIEAYSALCGSHAQGLLTETSDEDWKILTIPTPEDLIHRRMYTHCEVTDKVDRDIHDIRALPDLLWKANPTYLEILFPSRQGECPPSECNKVMKHLVEIREDIAKMNLPYLWNAAWGMHHNRLKRLYTDVGANGYNGKNACHCLRGMYMLTKYAENGFTDFQSCIWMDRQTRCVLTLVKRGELPLEEVLDLLAKAEEEANKYEETYKGAKPNVLLYKSIRVWIGVAVWNDVRKIDAEVVA